MTPLKCVHLNSVTRFILITILFSIFSQSFDCKPANVSNPVTGETSEQRNISQPIDPAITNDKPLSNNDTKSLGNISQPMDDDTRPEDYLINTPDCPSDVCIQMVPPKTTEKPSRNNDTNGLARKRQVLDLPTNDDFGDNANDDKSYGKDGPISPENLLFSLQDYKIVMEPTVEKVNDLDYKVTLNVNVRRKSDDRKVMELPSMEMYPNNENALVPNSSIVESLKKELNGTLSKFDSSFKNNNRDTSDNSTNSAPTDLSVNLKEGKEGKGDLTPDSSSQKNETTDAVSSPSSSTSESKSYRENNTFVATSSTTMEPLTTAERSLTPLPPNEFDKRQENSTTQPETTTTSKLEITTITTSKPIDKISASTLSSQVESSETSHASSNAFTASTEVPRAVESRTISSTSNPIQTSSSSSMQPKMSEIELNHLKSLSDKQNYKPIKPIPETPWIPAYEVKPIGTNKQDTDNHIEYRFTQHEEEFNNRRNIPSNQPKLQPQPRPQLQPQPQPKLQPQPQPQPRPAPRLPPKSRYEPGMDMRSYNDRQPQVVKYDPYVPRNPSVPLKDLRANAPNNRNEPYAVEEIVHFEGPMQRLNTRQQKPSPELFVRIIRHYFENALSPAETIYTTKHKSPIIAPGQPVYQRSPASLSYQNSKP